MTTQTCNNITFDCGIRRIITSPRKVLSAIARRTLIKVSAKLNRPNIMFDHEGDEPYLSRYYLFRGPRSSDGSHPFDEFGRPKTNIVRTNGWSVVLHQFHRGDSTSKLHNHGWTWGLSFVLAGGYSEEKLQGDEVIRRTVRPFTFNFIRPNEFHRVDLLEQDAWTLFIRGPRRKEWFYKDRTTKKEIKWDKHVKLATGGELK